MTDTTNTERNPSAKDEDTAMLLQAEVTEALRAEIGLKDEFANAWAARITAHLRRRLGAQQIYIPAPSKAERDAQIYREFDGKNAASVMRRFGISRSRLYQIVEEQRLEHRATLTAQSPVSSLKTGQPTA